MADPPLTRRPCCTARFGTAPQPTDVHCVLYDRQTDLVSYLNVVFPHCPHDQHFGCWPPKAPDGRGQNVQFPNVLSRQQPSTLQPSSPIAPGRAQTKVMHFKSGSLGEATGCGHHLLNETSRNVAAFQSKLLTGCMHLRTIISMNLNEFAWPQTQSFAASLSSVS